MRLALVTICWNAAKTLRRTVESIKNQTRLPDEYAFVDGGSTDGTLELLEELCRELEERNVKAHVIKQQRQEGEAGIPSAWNQGIAQVKGDVIGLLNSDDWYEPDALRTVEKAFAADDGVGMVSIAVRFISPETGETKRLFRSMPGWQLPFRMTVPHPGLFVSRRVYDAIGLYDTKYRISADYDFIWRCRKKGIRMARLDDALVNMELGGTANQNRPLARKETLDIACRYCRFPVLPWLAWLGRTMTGR
ncbi:MAG: glycosyltransferase [Victivallales bacterium]|nr:glycosyltransferase [Victivallales bacterium]